MFSHYQDPQALFSHKDFVRSQIGSIHDTFLIISNYCLNVLLFSNYQLRPSAQGLDDGLRTSTL